MDTENIQLTALVPDQMMEAQNQLISWCERKIASVQAEVNELLLAIDHARAFKWSLKVLKSQHQRAEKRLLFFQKFKGALDAGYYIVPNFPVQLFAIRTKKAEPATNYVNSYWDIKREKATGLPPGKGEYRNPFPLVVRAREKDIENKDSSHSYADGWDELEFPVTMLKPEIIEATNRAMALGIFDQMGILPATRNDDPIIVGQIIRRSGYRTKIVSFMIAWHFNTNIL